MVVERFVVWSPQAAACMAWTSRANAERFARHWRESRLLGCTDWRVGVVCEAPDIPAGRPACAAAADAPAQAWSFARAAMLPSAATAANDRAAALPGDAAEQLARKDAMIETLQRKLNEYALAAVRDAAERSAHSAALEAELESLRRRLRQARRA